MNCDRLSRGPTNQCVFSGERGGTTTKQKRMGKRKEGTEKKRRRTYESQETGVKVGTYALLRRDLVSGRVLDDLVNGVSQRAIGLPAEPLPREQVGRCDVLYLCAVLHALGRFGKPREPVRREPECFCHQSHKLVAQTLDGCQVLHERSLEPRHVLLFRPLHIRRGQGSRRSSSDNIHQSQHVFLLLFSLLSPKNPPGRHNKK